MIRRKLSVALILVVGVLALMPLPVFASPQQNCSFPTNAWPTNATGQWLTTKSAPGGGWLIYTEGWLTVRKLYPCDLPEVGGDAFSAAMGANLQFGSLAWQIGYWSLPGNAGMNPKFVYTSDDGSKVGHTITAITPVVGNRYRFRIKKSISGGHIELDILDINNNLLWSHIGSEPWHNMDLAWWGWEVGNMNSSPGFWSGVDADADLVGKYQFNTGGLIQYDNIVPACQEPDGDRNNGTTIVRSGATNQILNVKTSSLVQSRDGVPLNCA